MSNANALQELRYGVGKLLYGSSVYRYTLLGRTPPGLYLVPPDPWPGNADRGAAILKGEFSFFGETVSGGQLVWRPVGMSDRWLAELHSFDWLRDLRTVGGDAARRRARDLVGDWLRRQSNWHEIAWRPDILSRRLFAWLGQHEFFCASADDQYRRTYLGGVAKQAKHLARVLPGSIDGEPLIVAIKGLIVAGLALPDREAWVTQGLRKLERQIERQILPDGGHVSRNPSAHIQVLRHLVDIRGALLAAGQPVPQLLISAIDRAAPFLRMLRHGDGGMALFNGGREEVSWVVDMLLAQADARGRPPMSAPHSGFERLAANRTMILVDTGAPPPSGLDGLAHAGSLSLELSVGKERLIVNCGARPNGQGPWAEVQRATAAHSTLVVDDTNSVEIITGDGVGQRPPNLKHSREESDGNVWLTASHDGYASAFGLRHVRRIYMSVSGDDIRGEDALYRIREGDSQARGFAIRFHLHPAVDASLVQNGAAVLMRLPSGAGWRLRTDGAALSLAESVYLGGSDEIRRAEQAVLSGVLGSPTADNCVATVKWALKRIPKTG